MKIDEMEPIVLKKRLKPKHLIMGKGNQVKYLICKGIFYYDGKSFIVIYDKEGRAYVSSSLPSENDDFFESSNIRMDKEGDINYNGKWCFRDVRYDIGME